MAQAVPVKARYLAPSEAGRVLGVSAGRVRQMVAEGKLPALVTPLGRLLPVGAVEDEARRRAGRGGETAGRGAIE